MVPDHSQSQCQVKPEPVSQQVFIKCLLCSRAQTSVLSYSSLGMSSLIGKVRGKEVQGIWCWGKDNMSAMSDRRGHWTGSQEN